MVKQSRAEQMPGTRALVAGRARPEGYIQLIPDTIWTSLGRIQNSAPSFTPTPTTLNHTTILFFPCILAAASEHPKHAPASGPLH